MATAVAPEDLALNAETADLKDSVMTGIPSGTAGGSIDLSSFGGRSILIKIEDSSGEDFTFKAGDRPPSHRSGLGDLVITVGAAEVLYVVLELSRFLQDDGKILFTVAGNTGSCAVFALPRAV